MAGKLTESDEADLEEELANLIDETPTLELPEVPLTRPTAKEDKEIEEELPEDRSNDPVLLAT